MSSPYQRRLHAARSRDWRAATNTLDVSPSIGVFFDGTSANIFADGDPAMSNIGRLFKTYDATDARKRRKLYVIGVGTSMELQAEDTPKASHLSNRRTPGEVSRGPQDLLLGAAGLPELASRFLPFEPPRAVEGARPLDAAAQAPDQAVNMLGNVFGAGAKERLAHALEWLERQLDELPTWPGRVHVDVFGFSRGASIARNFARQLRDAKFAKRAELRFLGIFDTVGSFGVAGDTDEAGMELHLDADIADKTVHLTALHEFRANYPLTAGGGTKAFLGAHSDVGGSYAPGTDGRKNHLAGLTYFTMCRAAQHSGVPLPQHKIAEVLGNTGHWGEPVLWRDLALRAELHAADEEPIRALLTPNALMLAVEDGQGMAELALERARRWTTKDDSSSLAGQPKVDPARLALHREINTGDRDHRDAVPIPELLMWDASQPWPQELARVGGALRDLVAKRNGWLGRAVAHDPIAVELCDFVKTYVHVSHTYRTAKDLVSMTPEPTMSRRIE